MQLTVTTDIPINMEEARNLGTAILDAKLAKSVIIKDVALMNNPGETTIIKMDQTLWPAHMLPGWMNDR